MRRVRAPRGLRPLVRLGLTVVFGVALTAAATCGSGHPPSTPTKRAAPAGGAIAARAPVELTLRRADGRFLDVGDLRGEKVVLFIFTTYDSVSLAGLGPLAELRRSRGTEVIAIAAEPSARLLVGSFAEVLKPPFPITYDPLGHVPEGRSALGPLVAVPTVVVLDRAGRIAARHVGYASFDVLLELLGETPVGSEPGGSR